MQYKLEIKNENGNIKNINDYLKDHHELIFVNYKDAILESIKVSNELFKIDKSLKVQINYIK